MKKRIITISMLTNLLLASEYKTQILPIESFTLTSETSGKIEKINFTKLDYINNNGLVTIDSNYEKDKLNNLKNKLDNTKKIMNIKEKNYKEYSNLSSISQSNKDDKLIDLLNIKSNILELENTINDLTDIINKKNIIISNGYYIKDILINQNEVIKVGEEIAKIENHNKSQIIFYINQNDLKLFIDKKFEITIDNNKIVYDDIKIDKSVDDVYISSYKVIITFDNKNFGSLVTIKTLN